MKLVLAILGILVGVISIAYATPTPDDNVRHRRQYDFETDFDMEEYYDGCGAHALIKKSRKIFSPYFSKKQYPHNVTCKWSFIGDTNCSPEFSCKVMELRKLDDDCSSEYLKVSDGVGGEKVYCGKHVFEKPIRASQGSKDLYVEFQSGQDANFPDANAGFYCEAHCSKDVDSSEELPVVQQRKQDDRCVCGLQNKDDRIVGGEDAKMNEFPWQAAIVSAGTRQAACGGSVINDRFILTAAHCFPGHVQPSQIEVLTHAWLLDQTRTHYNTGTDKEIGEEGGTKSSGWNLSKATDEMEGTQRYKVAEIINHPLFNREFDYDVSLLRLEKKIDLSAPNSPTPVCIPGVGQYEEGFEDQLPTVIGWGTADEKAGGTTRILQKLKVPVLDLKICQSWMSSELTQRMLCAGYEDGKKDACQGDSGGPLAFQQPNKQWNQIGVVSWGEGCARRHSPGFYSRLTEMSQWINYHTSAHGAIWCKDTK